MGQRGEKVSECKMWEEKRALQDERNVQRSFMNEVGDRESVHTTLNSQSLPTMTATPLAILVKLELVCPWCARVRPLGTLECRVLGVRSSQ